MVRTKRTRENVTAHSNLPVIRLGFNPFPPYMPCHSFSSHILTHINSNAKNHNCATHKRTNECEYVSVCGVKKGVEMSFHSSTIFSNSLNNNGCACAFDIFRFFFLWVRVSIHAHSTPFQQITHSRQQFTPILYIPPRLVLSHSNPLTNIFAKQPSQLRILF